MTGLASGEQLGRVGILVVSPEQGDGHVPVVKKAKVLPVQGKNPGKAVCEVVRGHLAPMTGEQEGAGVGGGDSCGVQKAELQRLSEQQEPRDLVGEGRRIILADTFSLAFGLLGLVVDAVGHESTL